MLGGARGGGGKRQSKIGSLRASSVVIAVLKSRSYVVYMSFWGLGKREQPPQKLQSLQSLFWTTGHIKDGHGILPKSYCVTPKKPRCVGCMFFGLSNILNVAYLLRYCLQCKQAPAAIV